MVDFDKAFKKTPDSFSQGISAHLRALQKKEEIIMRKKLSVGFVFAIVLILAAVTALAVTIWNVLGEKAVQLEAEQGYFFEWDTESRILFVNELQAMGVVMPDSETAKMNDPSLPLTERHAYATKIMVDLYGREDAISHRDVLEKEKGPFETWSLEDKAWYSQLLEKYDYLGWDTEYNMLPGERDISAEQAVQIAANAISSKYGIDMSIIPTDEAMVSFYRYPKDNVEPVWVIEFPGNNHVKLTASGEIMEDYGVFSIVDEEAQLPNWQQEADEQELAAFLSEMEKAKGPLHTWSLEDKLVISDIYRLPTDNDIDEETAILKAKEAVMNAYGLDEQTIAQYTAFVWLVCESKYLGPDRTWDYCYRVNFGTIDQEQLWGVLMMSDTGEIIETYMNTEGENNSVG